jgi:hypothetical protein
MLVSCNASLGWIRSGRFFVAQLFAIANRVWNTAEEVMLKRHSLGCMAPVHCARDKWGGRPGI